jgi:hypothetical protein
MIKSIFGGFLSAFQTTKAVYTTSQTCEEIREQIRFVIDQKEMFDFKYNLMGRLSKTDSFELTRRSGLIYFRGGGDPVTILGKFTPNQDNKTVIEVRFQPNWQLGLLAFAFGLIGFVGWCSALFTYRIEAVIVGFLGTSVAIVMWSMSKHSKDYYKKEFERALDL